MSDFGSQDQPNIWIIHCPVCQEQEADYSEEYIFTCKTCNGQWDEGDVVAYNPAIVAQYYREFTAARESNK